MMIKHKITRYWQASSIKKKLSMMFTLMNIVTVMLILVMLSIGQYFRLKNNLISSVAVQSEMLSQMIAPALLFDDKENATELLSRFKHAKYVLCAEVVELQSGKTYAKYLSVDEQRMQNQRAGMFARFRAMTLTYPILVNNQHVSDLKALISLRPIYVELFWDALVALLVTCMALVVSFFLGGNILNAISESIVQLTSFVKVLSKQPNYAMRYRHDTNQDEVGELAQGFNQLLNNLEQHELHLQIELTRRKQAEKQFERLAMFDNVTGLLNRYSFHEYMHKQIQDYAITQVGFYLMFIDLDDFKIINDTFGHSAGDALLNAVGHRIEGSLNYEKARVFRIGGDEFAVVIHDQALLSEVDAAAQQIIQQLNKPVLLDQFTGYVGASIGICHFPQQASNYSELLSRADAAMYQAKFISKNCFIHFDRSLEDRIIYTQALESGLRVALEANQFELYYQPIVDIQSLEITGFEALIRWHHPTYGMLSPLEFISVAEKTGRIVEIGLWVLSTACQQIKAWQAAFNRPFTIAVNVSAKQFATRDFVERVVSILQASQLSLNDLNIELTENSLVDDIEHVIKKMLHIRQLGIGISLDDFGTGFSSLSYLKLLPIKTLKIDKSFVDPILNDSDSLAIVKAIIEMTKALNIKFVAEGIEEVAQLTLFAGLGNGQAQGYLFSRPLPADAIESLLRNLPHSLRLAV